MEIFIKPLDIKNETIPYELLLLADPSRRLIEEYLVRGQCFIANVNDEVVGTFVIIQTHPHTYEIVNIAVKEEYQGRGIGKQLLQKAVEEAKSLKANIVEIGTGNSSIKQLKLYQECGFRIVGIDHDFFIRNYEEAIFEDGIHCRDMIRLQKEL